MKLNDYQLYTGQQIKQAVKNIGKKTREDRVRFFNPNSYTHREDRIKAFVLFKFYYFYDLLENQMAHFHWLADYYYEILDEHIINEFLFGAFGESGKTANVVLRVVYNAIYGRTKGVIYQSSVANNNTSFSSKVRNQLTSPLLEVDFGELVPHSKTKDIKKKRENINRVDMTNGTTIMAVPVGSSIRGVQDELGMKKADTLIFDDVSTSKIALSERQYEAMLVQIEEGRRSIDTAEGKIIILSNITRGGGIGQDLIERQETPYLLVPISKDIYYSFDGAIKYTLPKRKGEDTNWASRWVKTTEEARRLTEKKGGNIKYSSLEEQEKRLGRNYPYEMECQFFTYQDLLFKNPNIELKQPVALITYNDTQYKLKVYERYQEGQEYIAGADVAEGTGGDYSVFKIFKVNVKKYDEHKYAGDILEEVASFRSNEIRPEEFGRFINIMGELYNYPHLTVEVNSIGYDTQRVIIERGYNTRKIYRREVQKKGSTQRKREYGFKSTAETKEIAYNRTIERISRVLIRDEDSAKQISRMKEQDLVRKDTTTDHHYDDVSAIVFAIEGYVNTNTKPPLIYR